MKYIYISFMLCYFCGSTYANPENGPYKTFITVLRNCSGSEIIKPHPEFGTFGTLAVQVLNISTKSIVTGDLVVHKNIGALKLKVRNFYLENDQWSMRLSVPGFGCFRQIVRLFYTLINLKVDNKCNVPKGPRHIPKLDVDMLHHAWEREADYGRWLWVFNFMSKGKSVFCLAAETRVVPLKETA